MVDFKKRKTVVKALCLHIAHDCNLACQYCFAEEGEYHGRRALMSFEVGKKALDFLIANSGNRRNLEAVSYTHLDVYKRQILYGAIERLYELETLFVFYDMMRFWAVPKRLLGREEEAIAWRADFERRIKEMGKMRISFQEAADICADSRFAPCRYTRQIEEVKAEYGLLRVSRREMEHLRKLGTFPYLSLIHI